MKHASCGPAIGGVKHASGNASCKPAIGGVKHASCGQLQGVNACGLFGHRIRFRTEGATLHWTCERGCGTSGQRFYATAAQANRYANAFNCQDRRDFGTRPLLSMLPLKLLGRRTHRRGGRAG